MQNAGGQLREKAGLADRDLWAIEMQKSRIKYVQHVERKIQDEVIILFLTLDMVLEFRYLKSGKDNRSSVGLKVL